MIRKFINPILAILFISCSVKEEIDEYSSIVWESPNGGFINYRYRSPEKLEKGKKYPILLFLHGAGGRGADNKGQLLDANSITAFKLQRLFSNYNSYVFAGQVPETERWVNVNWASNNHQMPKISNSMKRILEAFDEFIVAIRSSQNNPELIPISNALKRVKTFKIASPEVMKVDYLVDYYQSGLALSIEGIMRGYGILRPLPLDSILSAYDNLFINN